MSSAWVWSGRLRSAAVGLGLAYALVRLVPACLDYAGEPEPCDPADAGEDGGCTTVDAGTVVLPRPGSGSGSAAPP